MGAIVLKIVAKHGVYTYKYRLSSVWDNLLTRTMIPILLCPLLHIAALGYLWMKKKKWVDASQAFEMAIQYGVEDKSVHYWQGFVLEKLGKIKESIRHYNEFIRCGRHNIWVAFRLARLYLKLGATYKAKWEMGRLFRVFKHTLRKCLELWSWSWRKFLWEMRVFH